MEDFDLLSNVDEGLRGGLDGTAGDLHMYHYIGEDGLPYRENRTWNPRTEELEVEQTNERVYLWNPSLEQKATNQDDAAREQAQSKEFRAGSNMYYTEEEIKSQWDADEGMGYLKEQTDWDTYWNLVTATTEGVANGTIPADGWAESPEYMALIEKSGIPLQYTNDDGDIYNFNGFGYSRDYKFDDSIQIGTINKLLLGGALGFLAGPLILSALTPALGAAGAKAATSAITGLAKSYMTDGELSWEDALMSAALSYGGSELSGALEGSGVLGDIGSKITQFGDDIAKGGGDILTAALQAGGMSLVTQLVNEGEIDWKDAAMAAAMAGGTAALTNFLSGIGKEGAEDEVLQEIKVTAQRKGTQVGEGVWMLEDGTVIGDNGNVLGNMDTLDLDGDGALTGSDLSGINPRSDYVDETYEPGDDFYNKYPVPDSTETPTLFTKEWADERYGGLSETQAIQAMERDGFTDEQITAYQEGRYDDINVINPNIVTHAGGWVENMEQPYTLEYRNGRHYIIQDGKLKGISEDAYTELYADLEQGGDWQATMDKYGVSDGGSVFGGYDDYGRPIYTAREDIKDWITLDGTQPPVTAPIDDFVDPPLEPQETPDTTTDTSSDGGNTGGETGADSSGNPDSPGTGAPDAPNPPNPATPPVNNTSLPDVAISAISAMAGITAQEVIDRINNGETIADVIANAGDTPTTSGDTTGDTATDTSSETTTETTETTETTGDTTSDKPKGGNGGNGTTGDDKGGDDVSGDDGGTTKDDGSGGTGNSGDDQGDDGDGTGTDDDTQYKGPGAALAKYGDGYGDGSGDGSGDGNGNGNGFGNGLGMGAGMLGGSGNGDSETSWSPLPPPITLKPAYYKTAAAQKNSRAPVLQSLFKDLMG